jgi:hypothetical protein
MPTPFDHASTLERILIDLGVPLDAVAAVNGMTHRMTAHCYDTEDVSAVTVTVQLARRLSPQRHDGRHQQVGKAYAPMMGESRWAVVIPLDDQDTYWFHGWVSEDLVKTDWPDSYASQRVDPNNKPF